MNKIGITSTSIEQCPAFSSIHLDHLTYFSHCEPHSQVLILAKTSTFYTIALNLCRNELRRRKFKTYSLEGMAERDEESKVRVDIPDEKTQPDLDMERKEAGSLVRHAVEMLPEKFKAPLVLRDLQELTYEEISEILDLPEGTVKSRINRGRLRVKEILKPYYGSEDSGGVA